MCKCQDCNCNGSGNGFANFYDEFTGGRYANMTTETMATANNMSNQTGVNYSQVLQSFLAGLSGQGVPSQGNQMSDAILNAIKSQIAIINSDSSLNEDQKKEKIKDLVETSANSVNSNPVLSQEQKNILISQINSLIPSKTNITANQFWQNNKFFIIGGIVIALGITGFLIWKGKSGNKA